MAHREKSWAILLWPRSKNPYFAVHPRGPEASEPPGQWVLLFRSKEHAQKHVSKYEFGVGSKVVPVTVTVSMKGKSKRRRKR